MSKRNIHRSVWRLFCGALAVVGATLTFAAVFSGPGLHAQAPESELAAAVNRARPWSLGHLSEWREGDILMRDYVETI